MLKKVNDSLDKIIIEYMDNLGMETLLSTKSKQDFFSILENNYTLDTYVTFRLSSMETNNIKFYNNLKHLLQSYVTQYIKTHTPSVVKYNIDNSYVHFVTGKIDNIEDYKIFLKDASTTAIDLMYGVLVIMYLLDIKLSDVNIMYKETNGVKNV